MGMNPYKKTEYFDYSLTFSNYSDIIFEWLIQYVGAVQAKKNIVSTKRIACKCRHTSSSALFYSAK